MITASYTLFETPIGRCGIAWNARGIVALQLPEADDGKTRARILRKVLGATEAAPPQHIQPTIEAIQNLLRGEPVDLSGIAVDLDGVPEINRQIYDIVRTIPPGETLTYGEIAKRLGDIQLARDVGQALGQNPIPIIVPCHRVLGADRKPGGFSAPGGVNTKMKILSIERAQIGGSRDLFDLV